MNFMEAKLVCKNHPYNNPQQGVCSSCLAEKLSNLSAPPCNYHYPNNNYYSLISNSNSSTKTKSTQLLGSSATFNPHAHDDDHHDSSGGHARHGSDSIGGNVADNITGLKKSRSMVADQKFAGKIRGPGDAVVKKKGGFLAKLIRSNTSKTTSKDVVMINSSTDHHSRSCTTKV